VELPEAPGQLSYAVDVHAELPEGSEPPHLLRKGAEAVACEPEVLEASEVPEALGEGRQPFGEHPDACDVAVSSGEPEGVPPDLLRRWDRLAQDLLEGFKN